MFKGLKRLKDAFYPDLPPSLEDEQARRAEDVSHIAALQGRGNVSIQSGHMLTRRDQAMMREEFLSQKF